MKDLKKFWSVITAQFIVLLSDITFYFYFQGICLKFQNLSNVTVSEWRWNIKLSVLLEIEFNEQVCEMGLSYMTLQKSV